MECIFFALSSAWDRTFIIIVLEENMKERGAGGQEMSGNHGNRRMFVDVFSGWEHISYNS